MRTRFLFFFAVFLFGASLALADEKDAARQETADNLKSSKQDLFSVSSDELSPSDSLNRISGSIDTGFASPEQSYKSKKMQHASPFAREKQEMGSAGSDSAQSYSQ